MTKIIEYSNNIQIKSLVDEGFYSTQAIRELSHTIFELDEESELILGSIGKTGPDLEYRLQKKIESTRDKTKSRLKMLQKNNFLITLKGENFRNIKRATKNHIPVITKPYALTLKGLLASLSITPFEENYMIKKYQELLSMWIDQHNFSDISIQVIKYNLMLFMLKHYIQNGKLTYVYNIQDLLFSFNDSDVLMDWNYPLGEIKDKNNEEIAIKIRERFFMVQRLFQLIWKNLTNSEEIPFPGDSNLYREKDTKKLNKKFVYLHTVVPEFVRWWYYLIERVQLKDAKKINPFKFKLKSPNGKPVNFRNIDNNVRRNLDKLGIKESVKQEINPVWATMGIFSQDSIIR